MFTIDAVAADGSLLQSPGIITIEVDSSIVGDGNDVKLWSVDAATGRWEFEDDLVEVATSTKRKRRSVTTYSTTIRGFPIGRVWFNFDSIASSTCYSKVRVYQTDGVTPVNGARVGVLQTSPAASVSYVRAWTDKGVTENGYCIAHPCQNEARPPPGSAVEGLVFVNFYQSSLNAIPVDMANDLTTMWSPSNLASTLAASVSDDTYKTVLYYDDTMDHENGPFYNWEQPKWGYSNACSYADESENSFDFILTLSDCEATFPDPTTADVFDGKTDVCNPARYHQLYNYVDVVNKQVESCYIKVYAPNYDDSTYFAAISRAGVASNGLIEPDDIYGFSTNCLQGGFTCLELKVPNGASCSVTDTIADSFTNVTIMPVGIIDLPINDLDAIFDTTDVTDNSTMLNFAFIYNMILNANGSAGIFCETAETIEGARGLAKNKCFASGFDEWAVKFRSKWVPLLIYIL